MTRSESIRSFRGNYVKSEIMSRVLPAQNDALTPFDPRAQISRVNVELSAYYREQNFFFEKCPKLTYFGLFLEFFLCTIMSGQFHVDPENFSPWVKWGQNVILSGNNPSHDRILF